MKKPRLFRALFSEVARLREFLTRLGNNPRSSSRPNRLAVEGLEDRAVPTATHAALQTHGFTDPAIAGVARQPVVFIDSQVSDVPELVAGVRADERVFVLDAGRDGVRQIADILAENQLNDLAAIQIVAHGASGEVRLGSTTLSLDTLASSAGWLARIGDSLAPGGDLTIYSCDVATGAAGQQFISDLARVTSADVAAAAHAIGSAGLGGSWSLDFATGPIEAGVPFTDIALANYDGLLPVVTETFDTGKGPFTSTFNWFSTPQPALYPRGVVDGSETIRLTNGNNFNVVDFKATHSGQSGNTTRVRVLGYSANNSVIYDNQFNTPSGQTVTIAINTVVNRLEFQPITVTGTGQQFVGQGILRISIDDFRYDEQVPVNSPPQLTGMGAGQLGSFRENGHVVIFNNPGVGILASVQDSDNDILTVEVEADEPERGLLIGQDSNGDGKYFSPVPGSPHILRFVGVPADCTSAIRDVGLFLANVDDVVNTGQDYTATFTVRMRDGVNPVVTAPTVQALIHGINEAPSIASAPGANLVNQFTYDRDFIAPFTSFTLDDPDNKPPGNPPPDPLHVDVSFPDANGALVGTGWTKTGVTAGAATWRFTGDYLQATAALRAVRFDPTDTFIPGNITNTAFTIKVTDQGDPFDHDPVRGAPLSATFGLPVSVDAKTNTSPVLAGGPIQRGAILEGEHSPAILVSSLVSGPNAMTDVDLDQRRGVGIVAATGLWQYSTDGINWTNFGPVSATSALVLGETSQIRMLGSDVNGQVSFTYKAWDRSSWLNNVGGTASSFNSPVRVDASQFSAPPSNVSPFSLATVTNFQPITPINDAPNVVNGSTVSLTSIAEDTASPSGQTINALFAPHFSDADDDQTATGGSSANGLAGVAVVGNAATAAAGAWEYSTNGGSSWTGIGTTVSNPSTLLLSANTLIRFVPAANFNGQAPALTVRLVEDSSGAITSGASADVSVNGDPTQYSAGTIATSQTITEVNDPPTAGDDSLSSVDEDSGVRAIPFAALFGNDSKGPANESTQTLTITAVTNAVGGTVSINGSNVLFTPAADYHGPAGFDYTIEDNGATNGLGDPLTDLGRASFTISPVADTPSITAATSAEDTQSTTGLQISRNAVDGVEVTHFRISGITGGTLYLGDGTTAVANGSFITFAEGNAGLKFTPSLNQNSPAGDTFRFVVQGATDGTGAGLGVGATVAITVTEVNDAPTAADDALSAVPEDSAARTIPFSVLTGNDSPGPANENAQQLTVASVGNAIGGTVSILGSDVIFTPAANFFGTASFEYFVEDNGATNSAADPRTSAAPGRIGFAVTAVADTPSVTDAATTVNTQTTAGLIITPNALDGASITHYRITGITNGSLFLNDGTTPVINGAFITAAQGLAGLKFTPAFNLVNPSATFFFDVQAATGATPADLGGGLARATITVLDSIPPETTIDSFPPAFSNGTSAAFSFSGTDNVVPSILTFEISLNGSTFAAATSPIGFTGLADGTHTVQVRAIDAVGNVDPTPASYTWVVDTAGPTTLISVPTATVAGAGPVSFTVTYVDANFGAATLTSADVNMIATGDAAASTVTVTPVDATTFTVTLSGLSGDGTLAISIDAGTAADLAGNAAVATGPSATFTVDNTKPVVTISPPSVSTTPGGPVSFTVTAADANPGSISLTEAEVTLIPSTPTLTGTITVTGAGTTRTITISDIKGGAGTFQIALPAGVATDAAGNASNAPAASASVDVTGSRLLDVKIEPPPVRVPAGTLVRFKVDFANNGTQATDGAYLIVKKPLFGKFNASQSTPGWTKLGNRLFRFDLGTLSAGETGRVKFAVNFLPTTPPGTVAVFRAQIFDALSNGTVLDTGKKLLTIGSPRWL